MLKKENNKDDFKSRYFEIKKNKIVLNKTFKKMKIKKKKKRPSSVFFVG